MQTNNDTIKITNNDTIKIAEARGFKRGYEQGQKDLIGKINEVIAFHGGVINDVVADTFPHIAKQVKR